MNISQLVNSYLASNTASSNTQTQSTGSVNPVASALLRANQRIQAQLDTTTAQLSSFGKLKSSVSDVQLAARSLSKFSASATSTDVKTAANQFVSTFNTAISTAKTAASAAGGTQAQATGASNVSSDLIRTVRASTATVDALKKLGITLKSDGTMALDATKFDAAQKADPASVKATLSKIGQLVDATATKELATSGNVNGSMDSLNQRSTALKAQQTSMQTIVQKAADQQNSSSTSNSSYGVAAYQSS